MENLLKGRIIVPTPPDPKPNVLIRNLILASTIILFALLAGTGIWWYNRSQQTHYHETLLKASSEMKLAHYQDALASYQHALSIIPTDSIAQKVEMLDILTRAFSAYSQCDYITADSLFRMAAGLNSSDANYYLGEMRYEGLSTVNSFDAAYKYTRNANAMGNRMAMYRMGEIYRNGGIGEKKDAAEAKHYFDGILAMLPEAANTGNAEWQYILGNMYRHGFGVTIDRDRAIEYYKVAARQDYPQALYALYELFSEQEQPEEAMEWLIRAANRGYPKAAFGLGVYYIDQEKDKDGYDWLLKAVHRNYSPALRRLGAFYMDGKNMYRKDIPRDTGILHIENYDSIGHYYTVEALKHDKDDYQSMYWIGVDYYDGVGVGKDTSEAKKKFNEAKGKIDQLPYSVEKNDTIYPDKYSNVRGIKNKLNGYLKNK
ncbi:MAG: hypothetical protein LBT78_04660 [Tannerella sp.]|nr:hypothetical protein [Tannerella sp.]